MTACWDEERAGIFRKSPHCRLGSRDSLTLHNQQLLLSGVPAWASFMGSGEGEKPHEVEGLEGSPLSARKRRDPIFQTPREMCKDQDTHAGLLCGFRISESVDS